MTHVLSNWSKKIGYGLLIVWVCGISPLIYFSGYSPHRGVQPHPVTVFQQPDRVNELRQTLAGISMQQKAEHWLVTSFLSGADSYRPAQTFATVASYLYQGFFWAAVYIIPFWNDLFLSSWVVLLVLIGSSAWLPPPEKPPAPFSLRPI